MAKRSPPSATYFDTAQNWKRMDRLTRFGYELEDTREFLLGIAKSPRNIPIREQLVSFVQVLGYEAYKLDTAQAPF